MEFLKMSFSAAQGVLADGDHPIVHSIAVAVGLVATGTSSVLAFIQGNDWTALALGLSGLGVGAIATYQRFRQVRREEDLADIKVREASRQATIDALNHEIVVLKSDVEQERTLRIQMAELASNRKALIDHARSTCPHKDQCPVSGLPCGESPPEKEGGKT